MSKLSDAIAGEEKEVDLEIGPIPHRLLRIPAGECYLGSPDGEEGHQATESPVRKILVTRPFYLGRCAITQAEYVRVMGDNPGRVPGDMLAVDQVTRANALELCRRLSERAGVRVTLPTEAQWEHACRAGTRTRFYPGDTEEDLDKAAWYRENSAGGVHPVGQKQPNAFGLYDMLGNVCEHCMDMLPGYESIASWDPVGRTSAVEGGLRGGAWMHPAEYCRAASRLVSNDMFGGMGVRIAVIP
jgi:formylglycine-generating enzyme required for sulfatase activity